MHWSRMCSCVPARKLERIVTIDMLWSFYLIKDWPDSITEKDFTDLNTKHAMMKNDRGTMLTIRCCNETEPIKSLTPTALEDCLIMYQLAWGYNSLRPQRELMVPVGNIAARNNPLNAQHCGYPRTMLMYDRKVQNCGVPVTVPKFQNGAFSEQQNNHASSLKGPTTDDAVNQGTYTRTKTQLRTEKAGRLQRLSCLMCEICGQRTRNYGFESEGKRRWCGTCAKTITNAVNINLVIKKQLS
eukprot:SAG11_NODE_6348_length_1331_cov_1.257305_1_plen_241_part_01